MFRLQSAFHDSGSVGCLSANHVAAMSGVELLQQVMLLGPLGISTSWYNSY